MSESQWKLFKNSLFSKVGVCPYVYGAAGPKAFDCSGFVQYCIKESGLRSDFARDSRSQYAATTRVTREQLAPGDLVFYKSGDRICHVAVYIGNDQVVHSSQPHKDIKKNILVGSITMGPSQPIAGYGRIPL